MQKLYALALVSFFLLAFDVSNAQKGQIPADADKYPYWIDWMHQPEVNFYDVQKAFNMYWEGRPITKGCGWKQFKRWEYMMLQRINPDGSRPPEDQAVKEYRKFKAKATKSQSGSWTELGPVYMPTNGTGQPNGMGRINAIAFHPGDANIIWAGAPSGGLWKTTDGGTTWTSTTDQLATLGVSSILVDTVNNPDVIYLGTGDRDGGDATGLGVYKSSDGGASFSAANTGMGNVTVGDLIMDPTDETILLAATSNGIYKSTDAGSSWSKAAGPDPSSSGHFKEIEFKPGNSNIVYATKDGKFYRSTDKGSSWTEITSGLPAGRDKARIAITPANSNYVYMIIALSDNSYDGVYRSTDAGLNFAQMHSPTPNILGYDTDGLDGGSQAWYDLCITAHPDSADVIYTGGINIYKSDDGGTTMTINTHWVGGPSNNNLPPVHADIHCLEWSPHTGDLYSGNDGGVHYTPDNGSSWPEISSGMGIAQIYRIGQSPADENIVVNGYQDNGSSMFNNEAWTTIRGGDGMECIADDDNYQYASYVGGDINRHANGAYQGKLAANGTNGITESGAWVTPFVLHTAYDTIMFIGYKNIWRSTNIREATITNVTWTKISALSGDDISVVEQSEANNDVMYVANYGNKLYRSDNVNNASPTWTDLTTNLPVAATPSDIEVHPGGADTVYMVLNKKVYKSTDKGVNWTDISGSLPSITMYCMVFDTSSVEDLYLGTEAGVYFKADSMSDWQLFRDGLPVNAQVMELEIYYDTASGKGKSLRAATHGRGPWSSDLYSVPAKPTADFTYLSDDFCTPAYYAFFDRSTDRPTSWEWIFEPDTSHSFLNGTDKNSQNPQVNFTDPGVFTVSLVATNANGSDTLVKTNSFTIGESPTAACAVTPVQTFNNYGVSNFVFNQINCSSGSADADGGYVDFTCSYGTYVKQGDKYYMKVVSDGNAEDVHVYIDYNDDGDFDDAGEKVMESNSKVTHEDTITIPSTATLNTPLRLRVVDDFDGRTISGPCYNSEYGQTEDYTVIVIPNDDIAVIDTFIPWFAIEGQVVTIYGSNFTDVSDVSFNGTSASIFEAYTDSIKAIVPTGASAGRIQVTNKGYVSESTSDIIIPYFDFETAISPCTQDATDDFDWARNSGGTPSGSTGPSAAHGGSYYVFGESSSPNDASKYARLITPYMDMTQIYQPNLSFWISMYGSTMGTVSVQASTDDGSSWSADLWSMSGDQGTDWFSDTVSLAAYKDADSLLLRFTLLTAGWMSDAALDDIKVFSLYNEWTGDVDNDWHTDGNWTLGIPADTSFIVIPSGGPVIDSTAVCGDMRLDNGATLTINPMKSLVVSGDMIIGGTLLIKSDATGSGILIDNERIIYDGQVQVEQYIAEAKRDYLISAPVESATAEVYDASDEPFGSWDESSQAWNSISSDATGLTAMEGYRISFPTLAPGDTTVKYTGNPHTGTYSFSLTRNAGDSLEGFNLVGNPYPSPVSWDTTGWTKTNLQSNTIWFLNDGNYAAYNGNLGKGVPATTGPIIPSGQGFWVRVSEGNTTGTLALDNDARIIPADSIMPAFYKSGSGILGPSSYTLRLEASRGSYTDEVAINYISAGAANGLDTYDSEKLFSADTSYPQIYCPVATYSFAINSLPASIAEVHIPLGFVYSGVEDSSEFTITADLSSFDPTLNVYLQDFSGDTTTQNLASSNTYTFNSDPLTTEERLEIVVSGSLFGPLPIELLSFNAVYENDLVLLDWSTASEYESSHFVVEHSTDGEAFMSIDSIPAAGFSSVMNDYATTHDGAENGTNYYRLKMVDRDGRYTYSSVIIIVLSDAKENPWIEKAWYSNGTVNIELNQAVNSEINYQLVNQLGSVAYCGRLSSYKRELVLHDIYLRPGVYWLSLQAGSLKRVVPVVVVE